MEIDCLCTGILFSDVLCSPVDRAPEEGELVAPERIELCLGGCASNAALDLARLGIQVGASGCVGEDVFGQFIMDQLSQGGVEIRGKDSIDRKEEILTAFSAGEIQRLISKPTLSAHGVNWQHCHNMSFIGLSYSFEMLYQAIRRCWRFGQTRPVNAFVYSTETEYAINASVWTKQAMHQAMKDSMAPLVREFQMELLYGQKPKRQTESKTTRMEIPAWLASA